MHRIFVCVAAIQSEHSVNILGVIVSMDLDQDLDAISSRQFLVTNLYEFIDMEAK